MVKRELGGVWRVMPIYRLVLELAIRKPRGLTDREIAELLKQEYGIVVSRKELYHALLKLELNDYIRVDYVGDKLYVYLSPSIYRVFTQNTGV